MAKKENKTEKKQRYKKVRGIAKSARYFIGRKAMLGFFSVPYLIPLSWALRLSKIIVRVGYHFPGVYRRQALSNLKLFFGNKKSYPELRGIARDIGIEATKGAFEVAYSLSPRKEELYSSIDIEGREHLEAALSKGKGVIALSAHLGNFAVMGGKMISEGYPFHQVLKLPKDPGTGRYFKMKMKQYQWKFIEADPIFVSQKKIIRCLRANEIVCLIADGDQKAGGIPVKLMGQEIAMSPGPAILAGKTGAAILPMFIIRQHNNSHKIIIEPEIKMVDDDCQERAVFLLSTKLARTMEKYIHQYPTQWYWVNKKHRYNRYWKKLKNTV